MTIYAEDVNYWQSSRTGSDKWIDKAKKEILSIGGILLGDGFVNDAVTERASFMIAFRINDDDFKLLWPVLESRRGNLNAARIQAATALYHEVKAACVKAKFLGARGAFFAYLMLPDGRTASQVGTFELSEQLPGLLMAGEVR